MHEYDTAQGTVEHTSVYNKRLSVTEGQALPSNTHSSTLTRPQTEKEEGRKEGEREREHIAPSLTFLHLIRCFAHLNFVSHLYILTLHDLSAPLTSLHLIRCFARFTGPFLCPFPAEVIPWWVSRLLKITTERQAGN